MKKKFIMATSTAALVLMAGAPAYAESGASFMHEGRLDLNLGKVTRILEHKDKGNNEEKRDRKEERKEHAAGTVGIHGSVTAVSGTTITVLGKNDVVYTVNAANAEIEHGTFADIAVGDTVKVKGTINGSVITATEIEEKEVGDKERERNAIFERLNDLRVGIVTAITPTGFTIARFGSGTTTVTTDASTTVKAPGKHATSTIAVGSKVIVGGSTSTPDSITANFVLVLNKGLGWLKHWFGR
ncbi:MAG: hypothetical protein Athens041674_810 [Parcubacteria group bacterium Athens0416_74]|nr:MAG: hypothetical protein Athens041674_810 [Parcubacteria group bacterium Athens0416_74]